MFPITIRWKRPGMRRGLPTKLYDGDTGIACDGPNPGASAQSRYAPISNFDHDGSSTSISV